MNAYCSYFFNAAVAQKCINTYNARFKIQDSSRGKNGIHCREKWIIRATRVIRNTTDVRIRNELNGSFVCNLKLKIRGSLCKPEVETHQRSLIPMLQDSVE